MKDSQRERVTALVAELEKEFGKKKPRPPAAIRRCHMEVDLRQSDVSKAYDYLQLAAVIEGDGLQRSTTASPSSSRGVTLRSSPA
jgi:hypothetical protein